MVDLVLERRLKDSKVILHPQDSFRGRTSRVFDGTVAKNEILKGKSISEYHKTGLIRLLEISICSLEDRKISADRLLEIAVAYSEATVA